MVEGIVWAGPVITPKLLDSPHSYIKRNSVLKSCWADIPYVCWGEHCHGLHSDSGTPRNQAKCIVYRIVMFIPYFSYFHVCEGGLLPDVMHDLLEGALQYEVKVMLLEMITEKHYFSLDALNSRLATTELGYMETKDQPTLLDQHKISNSGHTLTTVVFKGSCFSTSYSRHFHCYKLHSLRKDSFFFHQQRSFHLPVHIRKPRCFPHDNVVIMPFSIINY